MIGWREEMKEISGGMKGPLWGTFIKSMLLGLLLVALLAIENANPTFLKNNGCVKRLRT